MQWVGVNQGNRWVWIKAGPWKSQQEIEDRGRSAICRWPGPRVGAPGTRVPPHLQTSAEGPAEGYSSQKRRHGLPCKPRSTARTPGPLASGSYCHCLGAVGSTWAQDTRTRQCEVAAPSRGWSSIMDSVSRSEAGGSFRATCRPPLCRIPAPGAYLLFPDQAVAREMFTIRDDYTEP